MRCMVIVKATADSEAGVMPDTKLLADMGNFNEELVKAGIMQAGEGLHPSSKAARVRFNGDRRTVIDGPFAETKELIAGFWMWKVKSLQDAIDWVRRCPNPHEGESVIEIRPVFEAEDFGEALTPELREQEDRLRATVEKQTAQPGAATTQPSAATTNQHVFVNLPIKDLARSTEFFKKIGYTFNQQFTDENATCMVISENIYAMLLIEPFFKTFTKKSLADTQTTTEAIVALSCSSRKEVDRIVNAALAAGGKRYNDPKDHGFMYQWGFEDLDGHIWEYMWMDPSFVQK